MSVVNQVILLVSVACVVVQEDAAAAAHLGFVGAQVMVAGEFAYLYIFSISCVQL